jgi:PIN domain nuclease of toxin-antitoxin system
LNEFLLDTHLLVWAAKHPERLSQEAVRLIRDPLSQLLFSAVSIWEIAIKHSLGRGDFFAEPEAVRERLLSSGYRELALTSLHGIGVVSLPPIHQDPFDRILIAQATAEGITLLTSDKKIAQYPGPIRKV